MCTVNINHMIVSSHFNKIHSEGLFLSNSVILSSGPDFNIKLKTMLTSKKDGHITTQRIKIFLKYDIDFEIIRENLK